MSTNKEQPDADTALKLMQGRWFHIEDENSLSKHQGEEPETNIAVREKTTLTQVPESSNLLNQFLAVVSGQVATKRTEINQDLREQNIAIMRKYIEYENSRDYENMENLFHPTEFRSKTYFGNDPISPKAHTRMLKGLFRAFPDWFMVINEIISADEVSCVALITGRGTQYEEFWGRPPADHQIAIPTLHAIKVRDGLIVEHRHINPFENIFANQIMAPLTEDIMAVRAQQGFDSSMAQRAYDAAVAAGAREEELGDLKVLIETKRRQCQVLLKGTLRRCAMIAAPGELYCEHHQEHGYGIDGIE